MRRYINTSLIVLLVLVVGACGSSPSIGQVTSYGTQTAISQSTQSKTAAPQPRPSVARANDDRYGGIGLESGTSIDRRADVVRERDSGTNQRP